MHWEGGNPADFKRDNYACQRDSWNTFPHPQGRDEALRAVRGAIAQWRETLRGPDGRRALQSLIRERFVFRPTADGFEFEAAGTIEPVVSGLVPLPQGIGTRSLQASADVTHPDGAQTSGTAQACRVVARPLPPPAARRRRRTLRPSNLYEVGMESRPPAEIRDAIAGEHVDAEPAR